MIMNNQYVSLKEASELLKMDESKVYELIKHGFLSVREANRRTFIPKKDLDTYARSFGINLHREKKANIKTAREDFSMKKASKIIGD